MFIWAAIDVDSQLCEQKILVRQIEDEIGFAQSNVQTLPLNISLKMSADVPKNKEETLRADIASLLENTAPFEIAVQEIEINAQIVWIRMKENKQLNALHSRLCCLFFNKYGIKLHEYDKEFTYHCTLFLDSDEEKIDKAFYKVKNIKLPATLEADTFIIGSSPEGGIGTYRIDTRINNS